MRNCRHQAHDTGGDQVLQADAFGKTVVDAPGNELNLREVFEDQRLAFLRRKTLTRVRGSSFHAEAPTLRVARPSTALLGPIATSAILNFSLSPDRHID